MKPSRPEGALLAGVCAGIARTFGWNAWVLRALFVLFLLIKTLWALLVYGVLALAFWLFGERVGLRKPAGGLESPELAARNERIAELEQRFRELDSGPRGEA